jgi:hypothetical protein
MDVNDVGMRRPTLHLFTLHKKASEEQMSRSDLSVTFCNDAETFSVTAVSGAHQPDGLRIPYAVQTQLYIRSICRFSTGQN